MLFNSIQFMWFFPIVVILYFCLPHKIRWVWLLFASYFFYMSWNVKYALLMAFSTFVTYLSGRLIAREKNRGEHGRIFVAKLYVALSFAINLSILFFFKYFNFFASSIYHLFAAVNISILSPTFSVLLPVGISFYTFQALSYTVDVYRDEIKAEKNLAKYALFVSFFPQLVAGPIERSKNLLSQVSERHEFEYNRVKNGLLLMMWGFFQKMMIADKAAGIVNYVFDGYEGLNGMQILFGAALFAVQIYCDFAGYSNIAIGAAEVLGFKLMQNFKRPYFAVSIRDFWRRWHISLSTWFRDYLYIPLGGSRKGKAKKYRNTMLTFLASGLWHGASWNYVFWGGLHGAYQLIGDILLPAKNKLYKKFKINQSTLLVKLVKMAITFVLVDFAWIFFRAETMGQAFAMIKAIFTRPGFGAVFQFNRYLMNVNATQLIVLFISIIILIAASLIQRRCDVRTLIARQKAPLRWIFYYAVVFILIILGTSTKGESFIYFQF